MAKDKGYKFTADSAKRIAETVRAFEGQPPKPVGPTRSELNHVRRDRVVKVRVEGLDDPDIAGIYKGRFVEWDHVTTKPEAGDGHADDYGTKISGTEREIVIWNLAEFGDNISELISIGSIHNPITRLTGGYIQTFGLLLSTRRDVEVDPPERPIVAIYVRPKEFDFVWLDRSGGVQGSSGEDCTYVYDVYTGTDSGAIGALIAEDQAPVRRRIARMPYRSNYDEGGVQDYGFGTWRSGTFLLLDVLTEAPDPEDC